MKSISLLICALGGEGGGVLTEWLVDTARQAGYAAQSTSIPGVAQRTGATTYYLEVFPVPLAELAGKKPVFSLNPVPGALDGLVSSELLETARQGALGMPSPERTLVITSSARVLTTQERMNLGDGRADVEHLLGVVRAVSREHHVLDMAGLCQQAGTMVSAVMLGAVAASGLLPFARAAYETVIQAGGGASAASLRGFEAGWNAVEAPRRQALQVSELLSKTELPASIVRGPQADLIQNFPQQAHAMLLAGLARMTEYQGAAYARLYLDRMAQVLSAGVFLNRPLDELKGRQINAEWLLSLLAPNPTRDLLVWMNAPQATQKNWAGVRWDVFSKRAKSDFGFDPVSDGPLVAAEKLARREGKWAAVAELYRDSYTSFPEVLTLLRAVQPPELGLFPDMDPHGPLAGYPQANEQGEPLAPRFLKAEMGCELLAEFLDGARRFARPLRPFVQLEQDPRDHRWSPGPMGGRPFTSRIR